ncbi:hypothetical protein BJ970_007169 [Saccharopolyspora phatthalungensis]|uniref:Uncharacterized protein n=1 Tax=Saccharopolyspora phatthalungensis TaxID=664693 RepID=A0A840QHR6_9PSEU|nr:hypothetical protein [Saccharopolyspora phatthalungensis]
MTETVKDAVGFSNEVELRKQNRLDGPRSTLRASSMAPAEFDGRQLDSRERVSSIGLGGSQLDHCSFDHRCLRVAPNSMAASAAQHSTNREYRATRCQTGIVRCGHCLVTTR